MPADPEVPEADALEQAQPVGPEAGEARPPSKRQTAFEVPEADALDQAREVPLDDDDRR
ncbi:MAG TPA: hypothetical protein VEJ84_17230 [Acidimicrobiales bacterium]|nr:hypothetical protein [Acidimicrobiales bacterium]